MSFFESIGKAVNEYAPDWLLSVADKTIGKVWEGSTGTLNPAKLELVQREAERGIALASGVGVGGKTIVASQPVVAQRQAAAKQEIESYLLSQNQHPAQAGIRVFGVNLDSVEKLQAAVVLVLALGLGAYFVFEVGRAYLSRR